MEIKFNLKLTLNMMYIMTLKYLVLTIEMKPEIFNKLENKEKNIILENMQSLALT